MQLGARWRVGEPPHRGVPPTLHSAIAETELRFAGAHSWTLTWLEGRPVIQLDDLVTLGVSSMGQVTTKLSPDAIARLAAESLNYQSGLPPKSGDTGAAYSDDDDEDDDDWLRSP